MAGGRSSPALFELIKPGPTPNHSGGPGGAGSGPTAKPPSRLTESPSKPTVQVPARAADAAGVVGGPVRTEVFKPASAPAPAPPPAPPPLSAVASAKVIKPEIPEPPPGLSMEGEVLPPPEVHDADRQAARLAALPEGKRDRWMAVVGEEFRRLFGDRAGKLAIALAVFVALAALIYGVGVQVGKKRERNRVNQELGSILDLQDKPREPGPEISRSTNPNLIRQDPPSRPQPKPEVNKPKVDQGKVASPGPGATRPGATETGRQEPTPANRNEGATPPAATPASGPGGDLREAGKNYLHLAGQLDQATAGRMAKFLGENGLPALVIGVDKNERPSNNPAFYIVVAAKGLASSEFNASTKGPLEEQVQRLGKRWKSEQKGWSDLSDRYWRKHAP